MQGKVQNSMTLLPRAYSRSLSRQNALIQLVVIMTGFSKFIKNENRTRSLLRGDERQQSLSLSGAGGTFDACVVHSQ